MNKKKLTAAIIAMCYIPVAFAGGILTNTNQSARFARLMALEASTNVDAAYYNPAGLARLKKDGLHFSFSNQSAFQKRIINSTNPLYAGSMDGQTSKRYEGTASAPIIPSLQGAYKKGKWVLSGSLAVVGGGGKATFSNGLPMFEAGMAMAPHIVNQVGATLNGINPALGASASKYSGDQYMTGSNFIYGAQLGGTYEINDMFSVYGGFRLNIVSNHYKGHLKNLKTNTTGQNLAAAGFKGEYTGGMTSPTEFLDKAIAAAGDDQATRNSLLLLQKSSEDGAYLDSKQSGWGVAPIIGFHFTYKKLNIGMKYEFKSSLDVENKTTKDDTGENNTGMFGDGVNTAHDIPALFTVGASYQFLPQLTANIGYHYFFDKDAKMAKNPEGIEKQKTLKGGTHEYLAGVEYQIDRMFLVSMGGQITRYGMSDGFQSDLSFSVNSYSLGGGGAVNVSKNVQINVGYFFTDYADFNKNLGAGASNTYTRKNKVFTAGVDFSF